MISKPGTEVWAASPSFELQIDGIQGRIMYYLPADQIASIDRLRQKVFRSITLKNGSVITFKSYEQGPEKFQSAGKDIIWFDEEPPKEIWEEASVREAAGKRLRMLLTMTPVNGMTWVYDQIYLNTSNPDIYVSTAGWDDNPYLLEEQKARMARGLTPEATQVRREGKFVQRVGLVCPWWDRSIHLVDIPQAKDDWTIYRAIDFGYSNPTCALWVGVDYDDNWYVFDGFYQTHLTTPDIARIIKQKDANRYIANAWGDSAQSADIQELKDEGIKIEPVQKKSGTKESWDEYRARLLASHGKVQGNGKPKIFVSNHLTRFDEQLGRTVNWFVQEIENLRWAEDTSHDHKPVWGKSPNHAIDALTYFAHMVSKPPEPNIDDPYFNQYGTAYQGSEYD